MSWWRTGGVLMSSDARQVLAEYGRRWKVMVEIVLPSSAPARSRSHLPVGAPRVVTVTGIGAVGAGPAISSVIHGGRSEEHTSELQSLMRISYAVFCLKKKIQRKHEHKVTRMANQL